MMELIKVMNTARFRLNFFIIDISTIGFSLHLGWEYLQCYPLFIHLKVSPTFWSMIYATLGDVAILWSSYILVAAVNRSFLWPVTSRSLGPSVLLAGISATIAGVVEYLAISRQLWAYTAINPTVNGVSVVPLVQMVTINSLSILITKKLLLIRESTNKRRKCENK